MPNPARRSQLYSPGLALFVAVGAAFLGLAPLAPPQPAGRDAPAQVFSAGRAVEHIRFLAQAPRPTGSPQQAANAQYLLDSLAEFGFEAGLQSQDSIRNVVARLPGEQPSGAILLVAHYDSNKDSPGAADNASGTAVVLETARALLHHAPMRNDLILLFTDGEEQGMLGASAFIEHHPWMTHPGMAEIEVVLNFDTFTAGPAVVWQISPQNGWLVQTLARSGVRPVVAPYLFPDQARVPYRTDLLPFLNAGFSGYNFWTIYAFPESHTPEDKPGVVTASSLQSAGEQALALAQHLGEADLSQTKAADETYFNLGPWLIHYPSRWQPWLTFTAALAGATALALGLRGQRHAWRKLALGSLGLAGWLAFASLLLLAAWQMIHHHAFRSLFTHMLLDLQLLGQPYPWKHSPNDLGYFLGFEAAALALGFLAYRFARQRLSLAQVAAGILSFWLALLLLAGFWMQFLSYLLIAPVLAGSLLLIASLALDAHSVGRKGWGALQGLVLLSGAPVLLLWPPVLFFFFQGTGLGYLALYVPITMLLLWTLALQLELALKSPESLQGSQP